MPDRTAPESCTLQYKVLDNCFRPEYSGPMLLPEPPSAPHRIEEHALENLRQIRQTMQDAAAFTALSGRGAIWIGLTGLAGAGLALRWPDHALLIWLAAAAIGIAIGLGATFVKARRARVLARPVRKFFLQLAPPWAAAALLTAVLTGRGEVALLPGLWLLLYGVGMAAGGALSVRAIAVTGMIFMLLGGLALAAASGGSSTGWERGDLFLGLGFGGVHLGLGAWIFRRHGG